MYTSQNIKFRKIIHFTIFLQPYYIIFLLIPIHYINWFRITIKKLLKIKSLKHAL